MKTGSHQFILFLKNLTQPELILFSFWKYKYPRPTSPTIKNKINSLKFYKNEMRKYPHSRSFKNVENLEKITNIFYLYYLLFILTYYTK